MPTKARDSESASTGYTHDNSIGISNKSLVATAGNALRALRSMSPFTPTTLLTFHHHTEQSLRSIHEVAYMAFIDLHGRLLYLSSKDPASLYSVESYRGLVLGLCLGFLGRRGSSSGRRWGAVM